ncbi:unnamed protein product [Peniophora sp. CBMAI 1063]|nr:unnamed protein product [Peniophora sp. CBMAI 1063]
MPRCVAYYCSGHGYGHATRVSAFASHLLSLPVDTRPTVHIVSSAPAHVFADSIALGAQYRNSLIDPVVVQPVAYRIDRAKSVEALRLFLDTKEARVAEEAGWLKTVGADVVLSDAAFLAFLAADAARLPSILVTNFTFDSVFSYLAAPTIQPSDANFPEPDIPIPDDALEPLVRQVYEGYRRADLLLRLPGHIPLPAFEVKPALPASSWVDFSAKAFSRQVTSTLYPPHSYPNPAIHPPLPFSGPDAPPKPLQRTIRSAPLLVRPPSSDAYTDAGRTRIFSALGVPSNLHDPRFTKVLIVSFGGQVFHVPKSRSPSRPASVALSPNTTKDDDDLSLFANGSTPESAFAGDLRRSLTALVSGEKRHSSRYGGRRLQPPVFTPRHINVPGAPAPASLPNTPRKPSRFATSPSIQLIPSSPMVERTISMSSDESDEAYILPDDSWIAIVCGASTDDAADLPPGFFVAPRNAYMPDVMAVGDVLLGKLGYGSVAEAVDSCTPFVFVSRPLFVEEHGLRLYLDKAGTGVEMDRVEYEGGNWARAVAKAWEKGGRRKEMRRAGAHVVDRVKEGREMAHYLVGWVKEWYSKANAERPP